MPRYFFDVEHNGQLDVDHVGQEFAGLAAVRDQALATLPNMAKAKPPHSARHVFRVRVRDESGSEIFTASLELKSEWLDGGSQN
jgi:hypothetical protein